MSEQTENVLQRITSIVLTTGKIKALAADDDFYDAGFSSINALQLLMELEESFGVAIADDDFIAARTCTALQTLISRLTQGPQ